MICEHYFINIYEVMIKRSTMFTTEVRNLDLFVLYLRDIKKLSNLPREQTGSE